MELVKEIKTIVNENESIFNDCSEKIWEFAEVGLEEEKSRDLFVNILTEHGFKIEKGVANIPTAFVAKLGNGKPVVGLVAEYDALPGMSQVANMTEKQPKEGMASGHACGHNLLGSAGLGAALTVKEYLLRNNREGTVMLFGTPSEERDACKAFMAREGIFDGVDAAFTWHPEAKNTVWTAGSLANIIVMFHFKGRSAHAAATPYLGRSALDSAELMNIGVNYLREHVVPEARIHYAYTDAGGTAPNVVQASSTLYYFIRAPKLNQALEIYERIKDIAKGAALMSGTKVDIDFKLALSDFIPNPTMTKILHESLMDFGAPEFDEQDSKIALKFFNTLSDAEKELQRKTLVNIYGSEIANKILSKGLSTEIESLNFSGGCAAGSTDVGDLSHVVPTAQITVATAAIGTPLHSWQMAAQGKTSIAKKGMKAAVGAMALAGIYVIENPELIKQAKKELIEETGGKYVSPIPKEVQIRDPKLQP